MADFTPQTKYDVGVQYYQIISGLMADSAVLGRRAGAGDLRAVRERMSTLQQWARCVFAVVNDDELKDIDNILEKAENKIRGNMIRISIIKDLNDAEKKLYALMKKHNMLTKMEHKMTGEDLMRDSLGIKGKPRGNRM